MPQNFQMVITPETDAIKEHKGKTIWQLKNNKKLLIEILPCENPREEEKRLLIEYYEKYYSYPYANWKK